MGWWPVSADTLAESTASLIVLYRGTATHPGRSSPGRRVPGYSS
jgi:hypothetical protein